MSLEAIAVRAYTVPKTQKEYKPHFGHKISFFDRVLVFGSYCTQDYYQNLKVGYFEIYQNNVVDERGLVYDPQITTPKELQFLCQHSNENSIPLRTIEEFCKIFLYETYDRQTLCVGFDLPFELTRMPISASPARLHKKDGFSLLLSTNLHYPRLHITHVNTFDFIEWGSTKSESKIIKGHFLSLKTLTNALTDTRHTLESACKAFKVDYQKHKVNQNKISFDLIKSCIYNTKTTYKLYQNAKTEFDSYQLPIPITRAYTPASIAKAILDKIGVKSFLEKNQFPPEIIGLVMGSFLGARTECKTRKMPALVDELDFLSTYPTINTLQNLWKFVIAEKIEYSEATSEITEFVDSVKLEDVQNPEFWTKVQAVCLVEPDDDHFPVRSQFGEKYAWNIGICKISSKNALSYPLADVIFSKLRTGKTPKILKAYKFAPVGIQSGLKEIEIHGIKIDPKNQDLFKELGEYRQKLKQIRDYFDVNHPQYSYYNRLQNIIKIISNAISYGIFVEINTHSEPKPIPVDVYGLTQFTQNKTQVEETGRFFNPIVGTCITSACRLMLGITEIILEKHEATHVYCDTDSMMVPPQHTKEIQEFFQPLNPYSFDKPIFKLEKSGKWFYGISTKRYCLYDVDENGEILVDDEKFSGHALGHLLNPFDNDNAEWYREIWQDVLELKYGKMTWAEFYEKYDTKYAMQKLIVTHPDILKRLSRFNKGKEYQNQIKPFNFALLGFSNMINEETGEQIRPFAPYCEPVKYAVFGECVDYYSGKKLKGKEYWKRFSDVILEYLRNPESKLDGNEGILKRKSIVVSTIIHIGKESNDLEKVQTFGLDSNSYVVYENENELERKFKELSNKILLLSPKDVRKFGISRQTLWNVKQNITASNYEHISTRIKTKLVENALFEFV